MKKLIASFALSAFFISTAALHAQTADEVIAKYVDAIGGKEKLSQVKSLYTETAIQVMGNDAPATTTILNGKGVKTEMDFNGAKMIQCFTEQGGWAINPMNGGAGAEKMPDEIYKQGKEQYEIGGPLYDYAAKGNKVELLGKDAKSFTIKVTSKDNVVSTFDIDAATYYITKLVKKGNMMGQEVEVTMAFSDYKKTDFGLAIPYTIETKLGDQFSLTATVKKAEVNKTIDPAIFNMPK
ncbi:MAG: hypothetical protein ABIU63_05730 [Chitinophagaceae bacterium]